MLDSLYKTFDNASSVYESQIINNTDNIKQAALTQNQQYVKSVIETKNFIMVHRSGTYHVGQNEAVQHSRICYKCLPKTKLQCGINTPNSTSSYNMLKFATNFRDSISYC